jgi:hypothetical protein
VGNPTDIDIYQDLCERGPVLAARKSADMATPEYPRNNPDIAHLLMNDELLLPAEAGDIGRVICEASGCHSPVTLALTLTVGSLEPFTRTMVDPDGIETTVVTEEECRVEWFVSGGTLLNTSSGASGGSPWLGPYTNSWHPEGAGTYTLWAVVRDSRGGNTWETYTIEVR